MTEKKSPIANIQDFIRFFSRYTHKRLLGWGGRFEKGKDVVVALLVVKRGKYSSSFLNTSFFLLVAASLIAGPIIVENNPFVSSYFDETKGVTQTVYAADVYSLSFQTQFSQKPRAEIEEYEIRPGDTLASIAEKFDISVETLKWQNNLKSDTIKPGEKLEVLPVTGVAHKVRPGESVYSIAKRYRVDAQNIVNFPFNDFQDLDTFALSTGQTLIVPGGSPPQAPVIQRPAPAYANVIAGQQGVGRFIWPTSGSISQYPVSYHMALDIANKALPGVIASDGGSVVFSGCVGYGYGCHVIIDHGNGFQTLYAHMSQLNVSAGQAVSQGQSVGRVGSTGRSTGPHLHFEIRRGGALQNPLGYLQ